MLLQQQPMARGGVMPPGVSMSAELPTMVEASAPQSSFGVQPNSNPSMAPSPSPPSLPPLPSPITATLPGSLPRPMPATLASSLPVAPPTLSGLFDGPDVAPSTSSSMSAPNLPAPPPDDFPQHEATVAFQVPPELLQRLSPSTLPPVAMPLTAPPPVPDYAAGERTVVAQVPKELLAQVRPAEQNNAQDSHYKEVYEKFLQTRIECGEDTADLTYDRFIAKLDKNKQMIMEKNNAKGVRFQVYVKEGKAALRAVPVRD
jgi:hypothetical protein